MADIRSLSDAELESLSQRMASPPSLQDMSDAELNALYPVAPTPNHPVAGPSGDLVTDAVRRIGTAGATALGGFLSLPHSIGEGVDWLAGKVGANPGLANAIGSVPTPGSPGQPLLPDFQTARDMAFNTLGATEYKPETWWGRRGQDALTGAITGAVNPASIVPAAAGATTAGAAAEAFPNHPMIAALLGFIPGAAAGKMAMNLPQRVGSLLTGADNTEQYGAFKRLDLPTSMAGTTTGEPGLVYAEKLAARMPGSEGAIAHARGDLVGGWQNRMNQIADTMGTAATPQEVGSSLKPAAENWLQQFKNQQAARWGLYRLLVPPTTPVEVPGFRSELNNVLQDFGGAQNLAKTLQPQLAARLKDALGQDLQGGPTLSSQAVHSVRTALGQMLEDPNPIEGMSKAAIKRLYSGLSGDIQQEAANAGPQAQAAFRQASDVTRTGHDILDNYVGPILKAKTPEDAAAFALQQARRGGTRLAGVVTNLPSGAGDLQSFALRNAAGAMESPTALAQALGGRRPIYSPEAMQALFPDPAIRAKIADLTATGQAMQPLERDLANSPTATHSARGLGRVIAAAELAKQGHEMAGVHGAVAGGAMGLFAPNIIGRVAQTAVLNPYMAALYGKEIPAAAQSVSPMARALIASSVQPQLAGPRASPYAVPATIPSSVQR